MGSYNDSMEDKRWWEHRKSFPALNWDLIRSNMNHIFHRLQGDPGKFRLSYELEPRPITDLAHWKNVAWTLCNGTIRDVIFFDLEYGRPRGTCQHKKDQFMNGQMTPPCYLQPSHFKHLVSTYVDWSHAEKARINPLRYGQYTCPSIARCIAISNSDGKCVLIDLLHLGGMPSPILQLFANAEVDKVAFDLASDLPCLRATVKGFPLIPSHYYDASYHYYLSSSGHLHTNRGDAQWSPAGHPPSMPAVFNDYVCGRQEPGSSDGRMICSLSDLVHAFTGHRMSKELQGIGLDWFLNRDGNLYSDEAESARSYALGDAVVLPIVAVGSLLIRESWKSSLATSPKIANWVDGQRSVVFSSLGPIRQRNNFGQQLFLHHRSQLSSKLRGMRKRCHKDEMLEEISNWRLEMVRVCTSAHIPEKEKRLFEKSVDQFARMVEDQHSSKRWISGRRYYEARLHRSQQLHRHGHIRYGSSVSMNFVKSTHHSGQYQMRFQK